MKFDAISEDSRHFIKLKSGEQVTGVFRGEPFHFKVHWLPKEQRSILCESKHQCTICNTGDKPKFRFRVNFIVKEGEVYTAKILEQGWTAYKAMASLQESGYDLEKQLMVITRQGSGLTTTYSLIPSPKGVISKEAETKMRGVRLNDLAHATEDETEPPEEPPTRVHMSLSQNAFEQAPPIDAYDDIPF